jgi:hypothetical protein
MLRSAAWTRARLAVSSSSVTVTFFTALYYTELV